jgi:hypothetical protein
MRVRSHLLAFTVLLVLLGSATLCVAQTADLSGEVRDKSQSVVPGASIELTNEATGAKRTAVSNEQGAYSIPFLLPGSYRVVVQAQGFQTETRTGLILVAAQKAQVDFTLEVGSIASTVTVTASPASIIEQSGAVGTVVNRKIVEMMPLNGRSFQTLIALTPGVIMTPVTTNGSDQGQFSANGQRTNTNYFTVDGVSANFGVPVFQGLAQATSGSLPSTSIQGGFNNLVSVDALEEFKIQTSTFAPEFGRSPGAQISLVSRGGTNEFHGSAFEYFRNDKTDARDFFDPAKPPLRYNDFGGAVGGPVLLPGLYDGKNRTFFFFSYEGQRFLLPQPVAITTVPTPAERSAATQPMSKAMFNAFPLPNGAPLAAGGALYTATYSNPNDMDAYSLRVDHSFNAKNTMFARFNRAPSSGDNRSTSNLSQGSTYEQITTTMTVGATQVLTSKMVSDLRLNYSRQNGNWLNYFDGFGGGTNPDPSFFMPQGFNEAQPGYFLYYIYALKSPTGSPIGVTGGNVAYNKSRSANLVENISYNFGSHQLKAGFDYRWYSPETPGNGLIVGYYFTGALSQVYDLTVPQILVSHSVKTVLQNPNYSGYVQDTWRVTRRLTLTYGTRWDVNPAPSPRGTGKQLPTVTQLPDLNSYDWSSLQLAPLGTPYYPTQYDKFGPRAGLAYQLFQKPGRELVVRGGWGLFYDLQSTPFGGGSWPYSYSSVTVGKLTQLPLPAGFVQIPAVNFVPGPTNRASSIGVAMPGYTMPRVYQWNLTLEQSLGRDNTLSVGYVAAQGRDLVRTIQLSLNANSNIANLYWSPNFSSVTLVTNGSKSDYHSMQVQLNRRMAKRLQGLVSYTWGHSTDDNSSTSSQPGYGFIYSSTLNKGNSDFDVRHSMSGALSYDIPKPGLGPAADLLFGNWSLNSTFFARSGLPFDVKYNELSPINSIGTFRRSDTVPGVPQILDDPSMPGGWRINPAAFALPKSTMGQGTMARNSLYGFGAWQFDVGLHRNFKVTEKAGMEFRVEAFNILNHPNFANPSANLTAYPTVSVPANFGRATRTMARGYNGGSNTGGFNPLFQSGGPRSMQFVLKIKF